MTVEQWLPKWCNRNHEQYMRLIERGEYTQFKQAMMQAWQDGFVNGQVVLLSITKTHVYSDNDYSE